MARLPIRTVVDTLSREESPAPTAQGERAVEDALTPDELEERVRTATREGVLEALEERDEAVREARTDESDSESSGRTPSVGRLVTGTVGLAALAYLARKRLYGNGGTDDVFAADPDTDPDLGPESEGETADDEKSARSIRDAEPSGGRFGGDTGESGSVDGARTGDDR